MKTADGGYSHGALRETADASLGEPAGFKKAGTPNDRSAGQDAGGAGRALYEKPRRKPAAGFLLGCIP